MLNTVRILPVLLLWAAVASFSCFNVAVVCAQKTALEPVTIQLRWFHQFQFAGYYAAIEKGFYADEGLQVSLREFEPGKDRIAPVLEGKAQYGVGDPALLRLRFQGKPVVVLAQIFQHSPSVLITLRESGIFSPDELAGKKVMMTRDGLGGAPIRAMILDTLGDMGRITVLPRTYNHEELITGNVDAMSTYLSTDPFALKTKGVAVNIIDPRSYGIDFYGDNLFATENEINEHPERIKKMIRATLKGWVYALEHKEEIIDLIIKKYNPDLDRLQLRYEAKVIDQMIMLDLIPIGDINPRRYERIAETYQRLGLSQSAAVPDGFIYRVKPEHAVLLTAEERAWLKAHPDIRLGFTDALPPSVIVSEEGKYSGIYVDFLNELNKRLGTKIRLQIESIPDIIKKAKTKQVDGIIALHPTYSDKLGLSRTQGYISVYPTVFARLDTPFRDPADFSGKKVALMDKVYFSNDIIREYGALADIVKVTNSLEGFQKIQNAEADYFISSSRNRYLIHKYRLSEITPKYTFFEYTAKFGMAIRPDWPIFVSILNKAIESFSQQEVDAIVAKWVQLPEQREFITLTAEEQAWLAHNHTVRVRIGDQAPYAYARDGQPVGIAVDLLRAISEHTGIKFHFVIPSPSFSVDLQGLIQHTGPDLMGSLTPTSEREKKILFTKPYVSSPKFIFTRDEAEFVASMEHLSSKTVAVIKDYLVHKELAEKYPDINLLFFKNNKDALQAVSSGKAFSFIGGLLSTPLMINEFGLKNLKAAAPSSLQDATVAMAIRNDWPELRDIINKVLDAMPGDEKAAINNKWSTVKIEYGIRPVDIFKWFAVVVSGAFSIVLLFVYLNKSLAKKVRERTEELESSNKSLAIEVAERTNAEKALRDGRDYLKNLTDSLPDAVFSVKVPARKMEWANDTFKVLGYEPDECIGRTTKFLYPTEADYLAFGEKVDGAIAEGKEVFYTELLLRKKGGDVFPAEVTTSFFRTDGDLVSVTSTVRDISERKQKELRLQEYQQRLKKLASQLTIAEETERRRIAADLHDHVGQSLALARMQIASVRKLASDPRQTATLDEISDSLRQTVQQTRDLIYDLSPPQLNEIGLSAAIQEYLEEQVEKRHGIQTEFIDNGPEDLLDEDLRSILFRSVRELVTNVIKHSQATQVKISVNQAGDQLKIIVSDNGPGFDSGAISHSLTTEGGFGLFSIKERMADLGGAIEISSEPGQGTQVILSVPIEKGEKNE